VDDGRAPSSTPGPHLPRRACSRHSHELGIAREQVDYLFLTHVHLDHAGGAGQLVQALPNARRCCTPAARRT